MKDYEYDETLNEIRYKFNKVDFKTIPLNLKVLIFPDGFDKVIEKNSLPETLEVLIFGKSFNQKIKGDILPKKLKVLIFGDLYDQQLNKNTLPKKLKILSLGSKYKQEIDIETIPKNLEVLEMHNKYNKNIVKHLLNLKILRIYDSNDYILNLNKLPKSIEFLDLRNIKDIEHKLDLEMPNLKILKIDGNVFNNLNDLDILAPNVKFIELYNNFTNNFVNVKLFPKDLEYLALNSNYIEPDYNPNYEYQHTIIGKTLFDTGIDNDNIDDEIEINFKRDEVKLFHEKIKNLKYLSLECNSYHKFLLNNLPNDLESIKFKNLEFEVNNLPITISNIYFKGNINIEYLLKIPFGCVIHKNIGEEKIIINGYIANEHPYNIIYDDTIMDIHLKKLDSIGCQYYSLLNRDITDW